MLHVHRGERTDVLVDALARVLVAPPDDPLAADVVAVPTRGVERWITQQLARRLGAAPGRQDGVCADVLFPSPGRLVGDVVATAAGVPAADDPWRPPALVWPLLDVIDEVAGEPWCPTLGRYLGVGPAGRDPERRRRRYAAADRISRLFSAYAAQRPEMVRGWADGSDDDGRGRPLPDDLAWEAELWRRLRRRIGRQSPAERLPRACAQVRDDPGVVDLPARLSVFGPTRLTGDEVAVLDALAVHREVHLWLPHPSPALWHAVQARLSAGPPAGVPAETRRSPPRRRDDPTAGLPHHPLLASLGRDARELQVLLAVGTSGPQAAPADDRHHPVLAVGGPGPRPLLARIQDGIREDAPPGPDPAPLHPDDDSFQVHACYGPGRQVEVLRELLLGLLADDPTLEPRDVVVMCPDVEAFAPLVTAAFSPPSTGAEDATTGHPGHTIRVSLADRSLRRTNPLLDVAATLLDLAGSRCTSTQVLDLADRPVVRHRFGLDDDAVGRIREWVTASGIRWGLDAAGRAGYQLAHLPHNTWRTGLDRILTGVAMRDDDGRALATAVPLDDVGGDDLDLAGTLAEFVDRLALALHSLAGERPLESWWHAIDTAVTSLARPLPGQEWQEAEVRREFAGLAAAAGGHAATVPLGVADVRAALGRATRGRPTRANFRTGDLTVCSLVPMRSVPHRVVVLLGMDDGVGGGEPPDGDDVLARDPVVGERDRVSEDRQLLLDAVLSARDRLVVVHTGADDRTNQPLPPAVPVLELLDVADRAARTPDGRAVRDVITVRHPLQPFDPRHFGVPAPPGHPQEGRTAAHSFDRVARGGALAMAGERTSPPPTGPLPSPAPGDVDLADLVAFVEHPVKAHLRQRLGVTLSDHGDDVREDVPAGLDPLAAWQVGDRLLRARLRGAPTDEAIRLERLRGLVPPLALGTRAVRAVREEVDLVADAARPWLGPVPEVVDAVVGLPDGTRVAGSVPNVVDAIAERSRTVVRVEFSRLGPKHRLRAWVQVLALAAGNPGLPWRAVTIGRGAAGDGPPAAGLSTIDAPPAPEALAILVDLVDLHRAGLREPLPLAIRSSAAYAWQRLGRSGDVRSAQRAAAGAWTRRDGGGEGSEAEHLQIWGDVEIAVLCAAPPRDAEGTIPAARGEPSRFGSLACRLWQPLLAHERLTS